MWISGMRRGCAGNRRRLACVPLATLVWLSLVCGGPATASRIGFPDDVVLSDPTSKRLAHGEEYLVEILSADADLEPDGSWPNEVGSTITVNAQVSFFDAQPDANEYMVVFTSLRLGTATSVTCSELSPGGALPFANFQYASTSGTGAVIREETPSDSRMAGESQVCNAEDASGSFFGLIFAPNGSEPLQFSFQIATTKDDVSAADLLQLRTLKQGYKARVPEPSTALLLLSGLGGISWFSRRAGLAGRTSS
jgi:hypothetical protein